MKKLFLICLFFLPSLSQASFTIQGTLTIGGVTYTFPSNPGTNGQCLETDGNTPATLVWATCGGAVVSSFLLLEDASFFLLEDGTKLVLN